MGVEPAAHSSFVRTVNKVNEVHQGSRAKPADFNFCFQLSAFLPVAAPWRMPNARTRRITDNGRPTTDLWLLVPLRGVPGSLCLVKRA